MRSIRKVRSANDGRHRRHLRVRKKIEGTPERPRLVVFRSSKHIYAQLVDDQKGVTLAGVADTSDGMQIDGKGEVSRSFGVGELLAAKAKETGIAKVVFDRGGYQYHGRVKAVADGARKGGLEFYGRAKRRHSRFDQRPGGRRSRGGIARASRPQHRGASPAPRPPRSEEHTSELQS